MDPKRSPRAFVSVCVACAALILVLSPVRFAPRDRVTAAPAAAITFQGRVYEGTTGTEPPTALPIAGAVVSLYCGANPAPDPGAFVTSDTTDSNGFYALDTTDDLGCEYWHVRETNPAGRTSDGATSVDGTTITPDWVQFDVLDALIAEQDLTGIKFWDSAPAGTVTCTSCADCTAKLNGTYAVVRLGNDLAVSYSGGTCIDVGANGVTFDGMGHTVRNTATGAELDIGVGLNGRTHVTVTGVTLDGWGTGLWLNATSGNQVLTNTITDAGAGILLNSADDNVLAGNVVTGSITGVQLAGADNNAFSANRFCGQSGRDIEALNATSGNTRLGDTCDSIYNWNNDQGLSSCISHCTPATATTCGSPAACATALNGGYGTVTLTGNVSAPSGITITGNHVTLDCNNYELHGSGTGAGLVFENRIGVTVRNCEVYSYTTGIEIRSSGQSTLQSNDIHDNGTGVALLQTDTLVKPLYNGLYNNTIQDNTLYGVQLANARLNTIQTNALWHNGRYDLWVEGDCDNSVSGTGGLWYSHDQTGGTISPGAQNLVVLCNVDNAIVQGVTIDNTSEATDNNGILVVGSSGTEIRNATLDDSRGIVVHDSSSITVASSTVTSSAADGITYDGSPDGEIRQNTVQGNAGFGIAVLNGSDRTDVLTNTVGAPTNAAAGGNGDGLRVRESDDVTVQGNWVRRNTDEGIAVEAAARTTLTGNTVRGNAYGVTLDNQTSQIVLSQNAMCYNTGQDVYSNSGSASGSGNTCTRRYNWTDTGVTTGCTHECLGWYNMTWGFSFKNPEVDDLSWTRYEQTFGEDEVDITVKVCAGAPFCIPFYKCWCLGKMIDIKTGVREPLAIGLYYALYENLGESGTCYGMSGKSLDFFYHNDSPTNYLPGALTVPELLANSSYGGSSLTVSREIVHGSQMSSEALAFFLSSMATGKDSANTVLNQARGGLQVRQMGMVSIKNGLDEGHIMNYDTVVDEAGNTSRIYVYDSNRPEYVTGTVDIPTDFPAIVVDRAANDWTYARSDGTWGDDSIFDIPYGLVNRDDWTLPLSVNGIVNTVFGGSTEALMTDGEGRRLGYDAGGVPHEEIPGAMGYPVWSAPGATVNAPARLLAPPGEYSIDLFGGSGSYTETLIGLQGGYILTGIEAGPLTHDRLQFRLIDGAPLNNTVAITTSDPGKLLDLRMTRGWDPAGDRRSYRIFNADWVPAHMLYVKVLPDLSGAAVANRGSVPFGYALEIRNTLVREDAPVPEGGPVRVVGGLTVQPGETVVVRPLDWGMLTGGEVDISVAICGNGVSELGEDPVNCPADVDPAPPCVAPYDDMAITGDTRLCPGVYEIADGGAPGVLRVTGSGLTLDCAGTTLRGSGTGTGIRIAGTSAVTVTGCTLANYQRGIDLEEVSGGVVGASVLTGNTAWGLHVAGVDGLRASELYVGDNANGIGIAGSSGIDMRFAAVCPNAGVDIEAADSSGLTGKYNACDTAIGWRDASSAACTYSCESSTRYVYLPVVMRGSK